MAKKTREEVLTESVKHLFSTIDAEDILCEEKGVWLLEGRPINQGEMAQLIQEAQGFLRSRLWKVLQMDVKWQANKAMFEGSKDVVDLTMGKGWLYVLDCIRTRLESMNKGRGIFNTKQIK